MYKTSSQFTEQERIKISQEIGLQLLREFDQICKKHQINYFLDAGTLLGAVRNNRFIEWDDDVDIMMSRSDYQKLQNVSNEFSNKVILQTEFSDPYYTWYLPRLLWKQSDVFYHKTALHRKALNKVSLDIFIIDNAPNNKLVLKGWLIGIKFLSGMSKRNINLKYYSNFEKILLSVTRTVSAIVPLKWQRNLYYKMVTLFNNKKTNYKVVLNHSFPRMSDYMKAEIFDTTIFLNFEGDLYPVPKFYNEYLLIHFGENYKQLPPEDKRKPHPVDSFDAKI